MAVRGARQGGGGTSRFPRTPSTGPLTRTGRYAAGQHFLRSSALAAELVRAAGVRRGELVYDLGAGTGVLTRPLAHTGARVVAVELDPVLARGLRARFAEVVEEDMLRVRLPCEPFRVVASLPFACTTSMLRRLLDPRGALVAADVIVEWGFAAKRTAVWPSTRLSVVWSAWFELSLQRRLPRGCFAPPPRVECAVLRATRRADPLVALAEREAYERFVERGFRAGLRGLIPPRQLKRLADALGFARNAQPRDLDARQWAAVYERSVRPSR